MGVHDILTLRHADKKRKKIIKQCRKIGKEAVAKALEIPATTSLDEMVDLLEERCATDAKFRQVSVDDGVFMDLSFDTT